MAQPWDWNEDDLLRLIEAGVKESIELEYKACPALDRHDQKKRTEISKDVSAFANSAGGTIVYGMVENKHMPVKLDRGFDPKEISKEWLEQVIDSHVQRRIEGLRIRQIDLTRTSPGRVAYVVHAPQSLRAPHQASDKRFYKRYNFQSTAMEEYEVRDVANRLQTPKLRIEYRTETGSPVPITFSPGEPHSSPLEIRALVVNDSPCPAEHAVLFLLIDSRLQVAETGLDGPGRADLLGCVTFHVFQQNWGIPGKIPILEDLPLAVMKKPLSISVPAQLKDKRFLIGWKAHAPRMMKKEGFQILHLDGASASIGKQLTKAELLSIVAREFMSSPQQADNVS